MFWCVCDEIGDDADVNENNQWMARAEIRL